VTDVLFPARGSSITKAVRILEGEGLMAFEIIGTDHLKQPVNSTTGNTVTLNLWVVYYSDFSGINLFIREIDALRHAVEHDGMRVKQVTIPCDLHDQLTHRPGRDG